jgi:hypothetical protein
MLTGSRPTSRTFSLNETQSPTSSTELATGVLISAPSIAHGLTSGTGMLLHWGEEYLRKVLPDFLAANLVEITVDTNYPWGPGEKYPHLDAETGEIVRWVEMPTITRVSRKRLRRFLSQQGLNIQVRLPS